MAATELTCARTPRAARMCGVCEAALDRFDIRTIASCWVGLWVVTSIAALLATLWPALAPATRPRATLHPSVGAIAAILVNNLRVLAAPVILVAGRFARTRGGRLAGDAVVAAVMVGNATAVGIALGRWGDTLMPFVPQLPIEYLAAATAAAAWVGARRRAGATGPSRIASNVVTIVALTAVAAAIEVLLTPHAR